MRLPVVSIAAFQQSCILNNLSRRRPAFLLHEFGAVSSKRARLASKMSSIGGDEGRVDLTKDQHSRKKPRRDSKSPDLSVVAREKLCNDWFDHFVQNDPLYLDYMTKEWGHEEHYQSDNQLFEKLSLEGAQAGLSWRTILYKRGAYRRAFQNFDIDAVASMTSSDIDKLMSTESDNSNELVVRHRGKLESIIHNAKIIRSLKTDGTISSLKDYLWSFVNHKPILNSWKSFKDIPTKSAESEAMSKELKRRGFKFVGPTTIYAFLQSCGFVIDHPMGSRRWLDAEKRLKMRDGGYQHR